MEGEQVFRGGEMGVEMEVEQRRNRNHDIIKLNRIIARDKKTEKQKEPLDRSDQPEAEVRVPVKIGRWPSTLKPPPPPSWCFTAPLPSSSWPRTLDLVGTSGRGGSTRIRRVLGRSVASPPVMPAAELEGGLLAGSGVGSSWQAVATTKT